MKLDFQIIHLLHPHYVNGRGCVYDHVKWTVWFSNGELLYEINEAFNYNFLLEETNEVDETTATAIWHYIQNSNNFKKWIGTYGYNYDRDILDIYNDYEA